MIKEKKSSTLREMYYISEGWEKGKFHSQDESNNLAEDLEVVTGLMREDFKLRPEENGASVIGDLTIEELDRKGKVKRINCIEDVGDSGYGIPYNVERDKVKIISTNADFIIAIETGGMFDRLVENGFPEDSNAVLVHLKGQPARSTRRFIKRLNEEVKLPVVVFTDGDPWSFRIFASVAYGAIKTAHISEYLATPTSEFIGITASDILRYDLPTDKLSDRDIKALEAEQKDPRFADEFWRGEIETMLKLGKKAEQQALAKYGLDYVTDKYLPDKLTEIGVLK
jgi:DNA topoisomerase-6 subunit A